MLAETASERLDPVRRNGAATDTAAISKNGRQNSVGGQDFLGTFRYMIDGQQSYLSAENRIMRSSRQNPTTNSKLADSKNAIRGLLIRCLCARSRTARFLSCMSGRDGLVCLHLE